MRQVTLLADNGENHVTLFEIGDVMSSAIDGTMAVVEETKEIVIYDSNNWNTVGYADRVSSMIYRKRDLKR